MPAAKKSLADAANLALLLADLSNVQEALNYQAIAEQSGSEIAGKLKAAIVCLGDVLRELVDDEIDALGAVKAAGGALQKRGELLAKATTAPIGEKIAEITKVLREIEASTKDMICTASLIKRAGEGSGPVLRAVHKHQDNGSGGDAHTAEGLFEQLTKLSDGDQATFMIKLAQQRPMHVGKSQP